MQRLAIFALIAAWFTVGIAAATPNWFTVGIATPKSPYSNFPPDAGHQARLDYLNGLEMIKVESGDELQQAVEAIPIESDIAIAPQQEADLRAWLYDFLVAFSVSGSDSLAAKFYLREGINSEGMVKMKNEIEKIRAQITPEATQQLAAMGMRAPELTIGATPFDLFKTMHRFGLDIKGRDYLFGSASFFDSAYRVFRLQGDYYESYGDYAITHGLLPTSSYMGWSPKFKEEIEEGLKLGFEGVAAEFMFIAEEPEEFAGFGGPPMRHPFFVRLVWNPRQAMWRLVEAFAPNDAPVLFLFNAT